MLDGLPDLVLIDLDGTLIDTAPDLAYCVDAVLEQLNRPARGETAVRRWIGNGVDRLLQRALTGEMEGLADPTLFRRAKALFEPLYARHNGRHSRLYPGVIDGLDYLAGAGRTLVCVTNKPARFTEPLLRHFALVERFALILSGDSLAAKKPDPLPLLHAARRFGVEPRNTLLIGDSLTDITAARAAGCAVVCVSYGYNHGHDIRQADADVVIDSLAELAVLYAAGR